MSDCLIALGSNIGDRTATLDRAVELLSAAPGVHSIIASRWHSSAPVGGPSGQGEFLNGAVRLQTSLTPHALLQLVRDIEHQLGRRREQRWAARTIDIDLLLYDDFFLDTPELTIPHPRMAFRRFVLAPAAEIAADMRHPVFGWTIAKLFEHLQTAPLYMAVLCHMHLDSNEPNLAEELAKRTGATFIADPMTPSSFVCDFDTTERQRIERRPKPDERTDRWWISEYWNAEDSQATMPPKVVVIRSSNRYAGASESYEQMLRNKQPCPWILLKDVSVDEAIAELTAIMESMR